MHDTFLLANSLLFLTFWFLGLALFYYVIKTAVRNGTQQANEKLIESVREIEKAVHELKKP
jgi:hypothetical protein